jgi:hypothetical protein
MATPQRVSLGFHRLSRDFHNQGFSSLRRAVTSLICDRCVGQHKCTSVVTISLQTVWLATVTLAMILSALAFTGRSAVSIIAG